MIAYEVAGCDQTGRQSGQFGGGILENVHDLRDDRGQHERNDKYRHDDQCSRVDHCVGDALLELLPCLGIVREAFQNHVQVAGGLAGSHGSPVKIRKRLREIGQTIGKRMALKHLGADPKQNTFCAGVVVLL